MGKMNELGIESDSHIVCYDGAGIFSSPRLWWMLRLFGHQRVSVLDGGMPGWLELGAEVETGDGPVPAAAASPFEPSLKKNLLFSLGQMRANVDYGGTIMVDARSAGRFEGTAPEPRPE